MPGEAKAVSDDIYVNSRKSLETKMKLPVENWQGRGMASDLAFHFRMMKIAGNCNLITKY